MIFTISSRRSRPHRCDLHGRRMEGGPYKRALAQVEACARELARRSCDFVIHGGAPLVLSQGKGFEAKLLAQLREIIGVPCTTSIVAAMELAVVDPYPPDLNAKMTAYLKDWGFEVASLISLGISFTESSIASVGDIYRAAKRGQRIEAACMSFLESSL
jgi:maleate cis-trans isomerase